MFTTGSRPLFAFLISILLLSGGELRADEARPRSVSGAMFGSNSSGLDLSSGVRSVPLSHRESSTDPETTGSLSAMSALITAAPVSQPAVACALNGPTACPSGIPVNPAALDQVKETAAAIEQYSLGDIYPLLGHCADPDGKPNLAERKIIPELKGVFTQPAKYMGRLPTDDDYITTMPKIKKEGGQIATEADWIAVDLLARTLYSEVASNSKCGDEYVKGIAKLILNRKDAVPLSESNRINFTKNKEIAGAHPVLPIVLADRQFAVWGKASDANKWAACPAKQYRQTYKFKDKKGNRISSGQASNNNWIRAMEVASEMIFREESFRKKNSKFTALYYTTSKAERQNKLDQCYHPAPGAAIDGKPVNNVDCMQPWVAPTQEEQKNCVPPSKAELARRKAETARAKKK